MNAHNPNAITTTTAGAELNAIVRMVTAGLTSQHSKRAYGRALGAFLAWYEGQGRPGLSKALVNAYREHLVASGASAASVNQALSAVRKLVTEAADNGLIDPHTAGAVGRVKGVKTAGERLGNWLTAGEAAALVNAPDTATLKGRRDRAILALMVYTGLRRAEVAALDHDHIQTRDGRPVIVDLVGKGGRVRSVGIPHKAMAALDQWREASGRNHGRVFVSIHKSGEIDGESMTPQAVYDVVKQAAATAGLGNLAAHDLRRTYAQLARRAGASIEQIQLSLGHASVQTTERYLGIRQRLDVAPGDLIELDI